MWNLKKNKNSTDTENRLWGVDEMGKGSQRVQTSSIK